MDVKDIITKYLSSSATDEEKEYLLQWLEENEENRTIFKQDYDLWLYSNVLLTEDAEMEAALARLKERTSPNKKIRPTIIRTYLMRIAASIILLLAAGYTGYMLRDRAEQEIIPMNHLLTGADGKGEYSLPDGSTVWLNANSVLKYPEVFTSGKRMVYLKGEALFEVKNDAGNPFIVEAGGMEIEVIGTRFLVNNYPEKDVVEAALVNGKVKLSGDYFAESLQLNPGELFTYNKLTGRSNLSQINTDDYTSWIHSKLVFDKTNLANIIINMEKWFGVQIVASPELARSIHLSFTVRRESLDEILTYISKTTLIDYRWEGSVVHLSSRK